MELPVVKVREGLTESDAFQTEIAFISAIGRGKNGPLVNLTDGGDGPTGAKHSKKARKQIGLNSKAMWGDEEKRNQIIAASRAARATPEFHEMRSAISTRVASDPEWRKTQSKLMTERMGDLENRIIISVATSKAMSRPEVKANVSAAQKARFERPEEIEKASIRATGRKQSDEEKAKRSKSLTGHVTSEETIDKITASNIAYWSDPVVLAEHSAKLRGKKRSEQARANIRAARLAYLERMKGGSCPIR